MSTIIAMTAAQAGPPVPIGYTFGVVVAAVCVGFAQFAPRWRGPVGAVSYRLGLVFNELPFPAFYLLLASTVLAFAQGDIRSAGGWAAVGGAVLVTIGLAGRLRRRLPYARSLFFPFPVRPRAVVRVRNRRCSDAGRRNLLDVDHRRDRPPGAPVLVYLHGGGYFSGRKDREAAPLLHRLAGQGWVCLSANYRLRPASTSPDQLVDAKKVIVWARWQLHQPDRRMCGGKWLPGRGQLARSVPGIAPHQRRRPGLGG